MVSPVVNASAVNSAIAANATSGTVTLTTTANPAIILVFVTLENTTAQGSTNKVTGVSKTSGTGTVGAFTNRIAVDGKAQNGNSFACGEIWWAEATTNLTSAVFTATFNIAADNSVLAAWAVTGVGSFTSPFDPNVSLPSQNVNTSATSVTLTAASSSTSKADDLLVWFAVMTTLPATPNPSGWTTVRNGSNGAGSLQVAMETASLSVSATQTGIAPTDGAAFGYIVILDALTADTAASGPVFWGFDLDFGNSSSLRLNQLNIQ